ncbi:hypothetical protein [Halalkalibacter krulwichiae]|uniref:Uncharacterized protein n=1 Tax=Halalkalibacter krulwichiae TaxID=199441 RepID=A0A1X9MF92_9BACI|nr:hypothetical protein [Halalkalibacter krulwichiae]ARK32125.1 hypothetical protein BkAM31D_21025 [Halalkalibacter krulwichiae]
MTRLLRESNPIPGEIPGFLPQHEDASGSFVVTGERNPLPISNYLLTNSGIYVPARGTNEGAQKSQSIGANTFNVRTLSVNTSPIEITGSLSDKRKMLVRVVDGIVYIGPQNTVTVNNGFPILAGETVVFEISSNLRVFGIAATHQIIKIMEMD